MGSHIESNNTGRTKWKEENYTTHIFRVEHSERVCVGVGGGWGHLIT